MIGKCGWLCALLLGMTVWAEAQTDMLLRVDGKPVNVSEYRLFRMREAGSLVDVARFVDFKLKALEARKEGLDTLSQIREALDDRRKLLLQANLTDGDRIDSAAWRCYRAMAAGKFSGRVLVSQIYHSLPQNVTAARLNRVEHEMDSIYQAVSAGRADFEACVRACSEEPAPFWVGYLQMPVEFEEVVFALPVGQVSPPFYTPQGIHVVKVLRREELPPFDALKGRLENRLSLDESCESICLRVERLKEKYGYKEDKDGMDELKRRGSTGKRLFSLGKSSYTGKEFAWFAAAHPAALQKQLDAFVIKTVLDCESRSLMADSVDVVSDLCFYRDSLLGAEWERRTIGERILQDSTGVADYFETHRKQYYWESPRYDGIVLHCRTRRIAKRTRKFLKKLPSTEWLEALRLAVNADGAVDVVAERGLFAKGDNSYVDEHIFRQGKASPMEGYPYLAFVGEKTKGPLRWQDVGGRLWTDYYSYLEKDWLRRLRRMCKVEINQEVLKTVNYH